MVIRIPAATARRASTAAVLFSAALVALLLLVSSPVSALRLPAEAPGLRVRVHVQWNQQYLSLAANVADPMVTGSNTGTMSAPQQDDAVEFCFETPAQMGPPQAHRLVISAAGGMSLLTRDERGHWRPDKSWIAGPRTLKFAVKVDGTLNDPTDEDRKFVVECAIPWQFLGGAPIDGPAMGFNVVCWTQGESEGLASWAPGVRDSFGVGDASDWGSMRISTSAALATAQGAFIPCPYVAPTPLVDGNLTANEWLAAGALQFDKPMPDFTPAAPAAQRAGLPATVLAVYRYDWRSHAGPDAGASFWTPDGFPATADQPRGAAGPWYSADRVDWHRAQVEEMQRAGIDVILPRYPGDEESRRTWATCGLDYLTEALKYRRAEGRSHPLVGMLLDTACLRGADVTSDSGKRRLYGMIREFFLHVSPEFRAQLPARPEGQAAGGVPMLLGEPDGIAAWDGGFLDYCSRRFAEDFDGARLAWLGSSAWRKGGAEAFYAYVRLPEGSGFAQEAVGGAAAVALSPGYCPPSGEPGQIRPRREGRAYRTDWQRALAAGPELILIDSWNDFAEGTEIAPSRQYGVAYVDETRYFKALLGSKQPHQLRVKQRVIPRSLHPGVDYLVEFLVENVGTEDVSTGTRVSADYRITRRSGGQTLQRNVAAQSISILAGQTKRIPVVISTRDTEGNPLPPGDYLFSLVIVRSKVAYMRSRWFTSTLAELTSPITVAEAPARRGAVLSTSLPSAIESGATEQVVVRLRNDGSERWHRGKVRLTCRWLTEEQEGSGAPASSPRDLAHPAEAAADLPEDVSPGQVVSVLIPITAPDRAALEAVHQDVGREWRLQWDLVEDTGTRFSDLGEPLRSEPIQVLDDTLQVVYDSVETPAEMSAGHERTARLVLKNAGSHVWSAGDSFVTPQWYRWDGRSVAAGEGHHLPSDVQPGDAVELEVPVNGPAVAGPYWLTWQATINGRPASALRHAPPVSAVKIGADSTYTLDLSAFVNVGAVTTDSGRARGGFDASGRSLPAEWLPPDQTGPAVDVYPGGYYAPWNSVSVPFAFPDTTSGVAGAVACIGQSIPLGKQRAVRVHLLAASAADPREATFALRGPAGATDRLTVRVPSWARRDETAAVGAYVPYRRSLAGDEAAPAYLYHVILEPASPGAVSLELPRAPDVRVLAITVETE